MEVDELNSEGEKVSSTSLHARTPPHACGARANGTRSRPQPYSHQYTSVSLLHGAWDASRCSARCACTLPRQLLTLVPSGRRRGPLIPRKDGENASIGGASKEEAETQG